MKVIRRHKIEIRYTVELKMSTDSEILSVQMMPDLDGSRPIVPWSGFAYDPYLFVLEDITLPNKIYKFILLIDGQSLPEGESCTYIGSLIPPPGGMAWHMFHVKEKLKCESSDRVKCDKHGEQDSITIGIDQQGFTVVCKLCYREKGGC